MRNRLVPSTLYPERPTLCWASVPAKPLFRRPKLVIKQTSRRSPRFILTYQHDSLRLIRLPYGYQTKYAVSDIADCHKPPARSYSPTSFQYGIEINSVSKTAKA